MIVRGEIVRGIIVKGGGENIPGAELSCSLFQKQFTAILAGIHLLKVNIGNKINVWNVFNHLNTSPQNGQTQGNNSWANC